MLNALNGLLAVLGVVSVVLALLTGGATEESVQQLGRQAAVGSLHRTYQGSFDVHAFWYDSLTKRWRRTYFSQIRRGEVFAFRNWAPERINGKTVYGWRWDIYRATADAKNEGGHWVVPALRL